MNTKNIHILLDMDGVLVNFVGGVEKLFDVELDNLTNWGMADKISEKKDIELTTSQFWKRIQEHERFWFDLEPYPWARPLVNLCLEKTRGNVTIVTSPDMAAHTYAQKAAWVMKHYPSLSRKLFIGPQKHLMAKFNHILIDDSDDNIDKFQEYGGQTILFPQKWNKIGYTVQQVSEEGDPISYIEEQIDSTINDIVQ